MFLSKKNKWMQNLCRIVWFVAIKSYKIIVASAMRQENNVSRET